MFVSHDETTGTTQGSKQLDDDIIEKSFKLSKLFIISSLFQMLLTVIPVLVDVPVEMKGRWYTSNDVLRILEPIIALPLQILIFLETPIPITGKLKNDSLIFVISFAVSAGTFNF
jgi:hypothetical protein